MSPHHGFQTQLNTIIFFGGVAEYYFWSSRTCAGSNEEMNIRLFTCFKALSLPLIGLPNALADVQREGTGNTIRIIV